MNSLLLLKLLSQFHGLECFLICEYTRNQFLGSKISLIIAPITDLSVDDVWKFLMIVCESPIITECIPIEIPKLMTCKPAYASSANGDKMLLWRVVFDAKNSSIRPQTTKPDADLEFLLSNAASNKIVILGVSSLYLRFLSIFKIDHKA